VHGEGDTEDTQGPPGIGPAGETTELANQFDAFISYASADAPWVRALVGRLERDGLRIFLDENQVLAGDVIVDKLEQGILGSRTGIVVFSPRSATSAWVRNEYAALMTRAIDGTARFIPVLYGEVAIPPFAAARRWVDFRNAVGTLFDEKITKLCDAIRGQATRKDPCPRPSNDPVRPEGPLCAVLRITPDHVTFRPEGTPWDIRGSAGPSGDSTEFAHHPAGTRHRLVDLGMRLHRYRPGDITTKATEADTGRHGLLTAIGTELGNAFLAGAAGDALAAQVTVAERHGEQLRLAVEIDDSLEALPWETLTLPGQVEPLALHPYVQMFRRVPDGGTTPMPQIPGPLRILVAVASPDGPGGGPLLDYEAELARILNAVDPARRQAGAYVRILNDGTVAAIRDALLQERFHVLHISCHASPGALILEDKYGARDDVETSRFIEDALPAGRGVPLIVLSGCSTALPIRTARAIHTGDAAEAGSDHAAAPDHGAGETGGEAALGGLARGLCSAGVPSVLAMTASVTDTYATALPGTLYRELAIRPQPEALPAFCDARRHLERERRRLPASDPTAGLAEWATPALFLRGPSLPLHAPGHIEPVQQPTEPHLPGVPLRPVGDFVARRTELRTLSAALRGDRPGVLLHGIGGVGKSSLAAELLRRSGADAGLLVSQVSQTSPDQILDALGLALLTTFDDPDLRHSAGLIRQPQHPWADRLHVLGPLLNQLPVTLLLDNFEDNLDADHGSWNVRDEELAGFLATWIRTPGRSRLLITSRHPFTLPKRAERRLTSHHLGPLSWPETRKLLWRLPSLDLLPINDQIRACTNVGGHPRTLEYLDALLRDGQARFHDVTERLEALLERRGISDPDAWFRDLTDTTPQQGGLST
jgi:hypothetical protein